ncbi:MAG: MotA/TolQ/ExbB proton channel family protein [Betaproteobacteria bacterium]|nr:MotA/TolQ/ExbB proton channel family protein [Betaproteobacteria bacterium]
MDTAHAYGIAAFLAQSDAVGRSALAVLLLMSLASWYLILSKTLQALAVGRGGDAFRQRFWAARDLRTAAAALGGKPPADPFSAVAAQALRAAKHHAAHGAARLDEAGSAHEFLARAMRSAIAEQNLRTESGLTALASVGATAPFVGLFGTVWGVYNALVNIGMTGQGTLDKVAGPVGEALIMTALGLVVAIPAVLAYNAFTRSNRLRSARLDAFAHDLFALLTPGAAMKNEGR